MKTANQLIPLQSTSITLYIKREDIIHPVISGNKFRKLKYNLLKAKSEAQSCVLTFGGAFSNHIAAVAAAAKENGMQSIGIIRGEELQYKIFENPTLQFAADCGMHLEFVNRQEYRKKDSLEFVTALQERFGRFYMLPEGGTNDFAIVGCGEILAAEDSLFDYICCAVGTGGTVSGIINSSSKHQQILAFPALKGEFIESDIHKFATKDNWQVISGYEFGGYGKINTELIDFINEFYKNYAIPLDPIYTGKMLFGVMDLIAKGFFPAGSKILVIHTGGLQGIKGMNIKLKNKNLPLIVTND